MTSYSRIIEAENGRLREELKQKNKRIAELEINDVLSKESALEAENTRLRQELEEIIDKIARLETDIVLSKENENRMRETSRRLLEQWREMKGALEVKKLVAP